MFQIATRLENPTKYHVLESQRRQVAEYLSEGSAPSEKFSPNVAERRSSLAVSPKEFKQNIAGSSTSNGRRVSGPFSPSYSSTATSPSEYAASEVRDLHWGWGLYFLFATSNVFEIQNLDQGQIEIHLCTSWSLAQVGTRGRALQLEPLLVRRRTMAL